MARARSTFGLVRSFEIEGGVLAGFGAAEAFTLGVEWGIAWERARTPTSSTQTVHSENAERISRMLTHCGRRFAVGPASSGFVEISIAGLD